MYVVSMLVLDVTVGGKKIYFGREERLGESLVGVDRRKGDFSFKGKGQWARNTVKVEPTILADMRLLPVRDGIVDLIIFDPPHMDAGLGGWIGRYYGGWSQSETIETLRRVNVEFPRVLRPEGFLMMKIWPRQFPLYETLLKDFCFFLPVYTYRATGSYEKKRRKDAAMWALGYAKHPC